MEMAADLGRALRAYRIRARINQALIARTLGVSQSQVSRWESGRDRPRAHNAEAIRALVWGRNDPLLAGLIHHVRGSGAALALLDGTLRVVAASPALKPPTGAFARFGWLFDPALNLDLPYIAARLRLLADGTPPPLGMILAIPFQHGAQPFVCTARLSFHRDGPHVWSLAEMSFAPDDAGRSADVEMRPMGLSDGIQRSMRLALDAP